MPRRPRRQPRRAAARGRARAPGSFAATVAAPAPADAALAQAAAEVVAVVGGWGIEGDDALHAVRAIRSAVHGFVTIEAAGGFGIPLDLDVSYERLVRTLAAGLDAASAAPAAA
jgi:Tetracyclin repressor-like, C-terminal domain